MTGKDLIWALDWKLIRRETERERGDRGRETERERGGDRGKVRYKRKKLEFRNKQLVDLYPIRLLHLGAIILKRNLLSAVQGN